MFDTVGVMAPPIRSAWGLPPDMQSFLRALEHASVHPQGFGYSDVAGVTAAWSFFDAEYFANGWVVDLRDGRRAYLEINMDGTAAELEEWVDIEFLPGGMTRPISLAQEAEISWSENVEAFNRYFHQMFHA